MESDTAKRIETLIKAERYLIDERAAVIPYYQRARTYTAAEGLTGYLRQQVGPDPYFRYASWKK